MHACLCSCGFDFILSLFLVKFFHSIRVGSIWKRLFYDFICSAAVVAAAKIYNHCHNTNLYCPLIFIHLNNKTATTFSMCLIIYSIFLLVHLFLFLLLRIFVFLFYLYHIYIYIYIFDFHTRFGQTKKRKRSRGVSKLSWLVS